jgi:hypothetical protein
MAIKSPSMKKCCKCKGDALIYDDGKYYCGIEFYTLHGICKVKNDNKKNDNRR